MQFHYRIASICVVIVGDPIEGKAAFFQGKVAFSSRK